MQSKAAGMTSAYPSASTNTLFPPSVNFDPHPTLFTWGILQQMTTSQVFPQIPLAGTARFAISSLHSAYSMGRDYISHDDDNNHGLWQNHDIIPAPALFDEYLLSFSIAYPTTQSVQYGNSSQQHELHTVLNHMHLSYDEFHAEHFQMLAWDSDMNAEDSPSTPVVASSDPDLDSDSSSAPAMASLDSDEILDPDIYINSPSTPTMALSDSDWILDYIDGNSPSAPAMNPDRKRSTGSDDSHLLNVILEDPHRLQLQQNVIASFEALLERLQHLLSDKQAITIHRNVQTFKRLLCEAALCSSDPLHYPPVVIPGETKPSKRKGQPSASIDPQLLKDLTMSYGGTVKIGRLLGFSARTIRRLQLKWNLVLPGQAPFQIHVTDDGTECWSHHITCPQMSNLSDEKLDSMVHEILMDHPHHGRIMLSGVIAS
ncbi:uncharacterized protein EV420DRAFT_1636384 [Desarmillaria tabescens]|uniref:Uncharacterized protein n=1 Tax=Armillaria tabescens TaxID=1929756 RepID=A0AA39U5D7_ARMTA|nr:uncharacterized protein EV420DRAFT_1636384 [Desarmillaria tabescens]KAK0467355.1 hypothetical protein EV420DRAFT_1636384 [Desarmillaria tabescens]